MLKTKLLFFILFSLIFLSGCSRVQLAYNQLDWLIPYYVRGYIELTEDQDILLDDQVSALLNWHCSEHLTSYAGLLRDANQKFQSGSVTSEQLQDYEQQFNQYWREIMQQVTPSLVQLFHDISDDQLIELRERFEADNRNWYEAFNEKTAEEIQNENLEIMQNELERWFDDLDVQQTLWVFKWSRAFKTLGVEGQHARERWQQHLLSLLEERDDIEQLREGLHMLFVYPENLRTEEYTELTNNNKSVTFQLLEKLSASLTAEQLMNLDEMISTVASDFDTLACRQGELKKTKLN